MHQLQLQYLSSCWYTWAWVKEWAGLCEMSGYYGIWVEIIYYLDNSGVFNAVHKKKWNKPDFGCSGFGILVTQTNIIHVSEFVCVCVGMHTRTDVHILLLNLQSLLLSSSSVRITWFPGISSGTTSCYLWNKCVLDYSSWEDFFFFPGTEKPCILKLDQDFSLACIFYCAYTCGFHAVNILNIKNLK